MIEKVAKAVILILKLSFLYTQIVCAEVASGITAKLLLHLTELCPHASFVYPLVDRGVQNIDRVLRHLLLLGS